MEVILLEKIENLGGIGDRVKVKSGYGRNFLLPQGKATMATEANIAKFETMRAEFEKKAVDELTQAKGRARELEGLHLDITAKAGTEGKLFGSVGPIDIADACAKAGFEVERSEIRMPDGPIRLVGAHEVELHLHADVNVPVTVTVIGEGGTELEEEALSEGNIEKSEPDTESDSEQSEPETEA